MPQTSSSKRLFISYCRGAKRDAALADFLRHRLAAAGHEVFIDVSMELGTAWSREIERRIDWCDFLVVLVSEATVQSEMVLAEVRRAHQRKAKEGRPSILPIRVSYRDSLGYELSAYLDPLHYILWENIQDNARIADAILAIVPPASLQSSEQESSASPQNSSAVKRHRPQWTADRSRGRSASTSPSGTGQNRGILTAQPEMKPRSASSHVSWFVPRGPVIMVMPALGLVAVALVLVLPLSGADVHNPTTVGPSSSKAKQDVFIQGQNDRTYVLYRDGRRLGETPYRFSELLGNIVTIECHRRNRVVDILEIEVQSPPGNTGTCEG